MKFEMKETHITIGNYTFVGEAKATIYALLIIFSWIISLIIACKFLD